MATTNFSTNSSSTVKLWSERALYDWVSDTQLLGQMLKAGVVIRKDETSRSAGDRVTVSFLNRITDQGLLGSASATGVESSLTYYTDQMYINQLRIPLSIPAPKTIDQQRVTYDLPEDSFRVLSEWMQVRGALGVLNQLAGNTATTITYDGENYSGNDRLKITGLNSAAAPSTNSGVIRIIRPNNLTTDQAVAADTTATLKLSHILEAETVAATSRPYIRPFSETAEVKFHLYCHTEQYNQLLQDTTAPFQFRDIQTSMINSGRGEGQILRTFVFSQTRVFASDKLPLGVNSVTSAQEPNSRRAVFVGRDAAGLALGRGYDGGGADVAGFRLNSDYFDIMQQQRYAMVGVFGIKKLQFNGNDNGVIVISTYSSI